MGRVEGKVAVVTGAASGIGLASSRRLAGEGATVIMADIDATAGSRLAAGTAGARFLALDVTSEAAWIAFIDTVMAAHGRLDVLFNCAGIVELASIEDTTEDMWRRVNAVGTDGTFFGCKHALRAMKPARSGSIIYMVLFLASDESRAVSGAAMVVDNTTTITEGVVPRH
jgi:3(or 17)beta-hydroxysteroid dehydrogenase